MASLRACLTELGLWSAVAALALDMLTATERNAAVDLSTRLPFALADVLDGGGSSELDITEAQSCTRLWTAERELRQSLDMLRWRVPAEGEVIGPVVLNCALCKVGRGGDGLEVWACDAFNCATCARWDRAQQFG